MPDLSPAYVLGHSDQKLGRLSRQAEFIGQSTRQFFSRGRT
jgi:hypothetical protein